MAKQIKAVALPVPLDSLTPETLALHGKLIEEWRIQDAAGLTLLMVTLKALDQLNACEAILKRDGLLQADRWGVLKPHPASTILRESRAGFIAGMKALNLDLESLSDEEEKK